MKKEVYEETLRLIDSRISYLLREVQIATSKPIIIRTPLQPPLIVDSPAVIRNLNSERLGGLTIDQVLAKISTAAGVSSLGEYGDPTTLIGNVKLKEGVNVTITRDDVNNALVVAAQGASGAPSTLTYVTKDDESSQLPNSIRHQNLSGAFLHDPKAHKASHETGGADAIASLAAGVITSGILAVARGGLGKALSPTWTDDYILVYKTATDNFVMETKPTGGEGAVGWENVVCYPWAGTVVLDEDPDLTYTSEVSESAGSYVEVAWFDFDMPTGTIKSIFAHLVWAMRVTGSGTGFVKWQIASGSHASPGTWVDITDEVSTELTSYGDKSRSGVVHKITGITTTTPFTVRCLVKKGTATSAEAKVKSNTYLRVTFKVT